MIAAVSGLRRPVSRCCHIHLEVQQSTPCRRQTPIRGYTFGVCFYPSDRCTTSKHLVERDESYTAKNLKVGAPVRQRPPADLVILRSEVITLLKAPLG